MRIDRLRSFSTRNALFLLFCGVLFVFGQGTGNVQASQDVDKKVEAAVLVEDWTKVTELLADVNPQTPSPLLRLIKGHACLAINRNNDSLCLFLSVSKKDEFKKWEEWTKSFVERNPKSAIAYYFKGDALARLEQRDVALTVFNKALEIHPNHTLILNARGVTYAAKGRGKEAISDFTKATMVNNSLADAYANLGTLAIQQKEGASGALADFKKSLNLSPNFILAVYGRGCIRFALEQWGKANNDFVKSLSITNCTREILSIYIENALKLMEKEREIKLAAIEGKNPGFGLDARTIKAIETGRWGFKGFWVKEMITHNASNQTALNQIKTAMEKCAINKNDFAPYVPRYWNDVGKNIAKEGMIKNLSEYTKATANLNAVGAVKGIVVKGSVSFETGKNFGRDLKAFNAITKQNMNNVINISNKIDKAGGFKTDLTEATRDEGNWLFAATYGLSYKIDNEISSTPIDK